MPILGTSYVNPMTGAVVGPQANPPIPPQSGMSAGGSAHFSFGAHGGRDQQRHAGIGSGIHLLMIPALELADRAIALTCQTEPISPADATAAYLAGAIDERTWGCIVAMHGGELGLHRVMLDAMRRKPEAVESHILRNRQVLNDQGLDKQLRMLGFTDANERAAISGLRFDVPGPSDLIRFAVRHAFEPEILAALGYHAEYRPALDFYHQTAGLNYRIFTGPLKQTIIKTCQEFPEIFQSVVDYARESEVAPPGSPEQVPDWFANRYADLKLPEPTWAVMFWWSHWILPSPGQGYQMLQRLRGNPANPATWRVPGVAPFTSDDLNLLLRANDYPPFWRKRLEAISYRVPSIRYMRVQIAQGTISDDEVVEQLRDQGYPLNLAAPMAKALIDDTREKENLRRFGPIAKEMDAGWELGLVDDEAFIDAYRLAGIDPATASGRLQAAVFSRNVSIGKELLAKVRIGYLRANFSEQQARKFMEDIGINKKRQQENLVLWNAERQAGRKDVSAGQARKFAVEGMLDLASYVQRLRNLDYSDSAIEVLLADVQLARSERESKSLAKLASEEAKSNRDRLRAVQAASRHLNALRKALAGRATKSDLVKWYCTGEITAAEVTQRLITLQWSQHDINKLLGECDAKRAKLGLPPYSEEESGSQAQA